MSATEVAPSPLGEGALASLPQMIQYYIHQYMASFVGLCKLKSSTMMLRISSAVSLPSGSVRLWRTKVSAVVRPGESVEVLQQAISCGEASLPPCETEKESAAFRLYHGRIMIEKFVQQAECDEESDYRARHFLNARGQRVFTQSWMPKRRTLRATVLVLHGLNEHGGRYSSFASKLNAVGFGVFCMDWTGHGCSDGLHGYVERLEYVVADARLYLKMIAADHPEVPSFVFGHSTGAAIALWMALHPQAGASLAGLVLTSPAIQIDVGNPVLGAIAPLGSALLPRHKLPKGDSSGAHVSRDPAALLAKYSDPLVYTAGLRIRTGYEVLSSALALQRRLRQVAVPFLVMHGTRDKVTEPAGSKALYEAAPAAPKKLLLYEGLMHDLLFEPEKEQVVADILFWMEERLLQLGCANVAAGQVS